MSDFLGIAQARLLPMHQLIKAKNQIYLLDFSCQNIDANEYIWFYQSKHKIDLLVWFNCREFEFEYFGSSDVVNKLYIFSNQICFLTGEVQKIELNFVFWQVKSINPFVSVFWQEKSSKMTCIFVLRWKFKQIYLTLCFNKRNQSDQ